MQVTCEVTPHHLTLTDEAVRSLDSRFKMNPPLRSEDDRQALIEALRDGTIDCIATDHAPHASEEKEVPFEEAAMGVTGLETAFAVLYTDLVLPGVHPAGAAGGADDLRRRALRDRGASPRGGRAGERRPDRPRARMDRRRGRLREPLVQHCFAGRELTGRVLMTVADGRVAYRQRSFAHRGCACVNGEARPDRAALVVVDVQEGFRKAIPDFDRVAAATATLIEGAEALGIPVLITEQYPKGLGETAPEVAEHLPEGTSPIEKLVLLRGRGRRLRPRRPRPGARLRDRDARLRQPDRPRPARGRASRSRSPRTRSARAPRRTSGSASTRWSGRAPS